MHLSQIIALRIIGMYVTATLCAPARAEITSVDSAAFAVNTQSSRSLPGVADSPAFNLNTSLVYAAPAFADSVSASLDTRRINRAWGDSESFSLNVPHVAPTLNSATPLCDGITPGIMLAWIAAPDAVNYEVFRNNVLIFTTQTAGTTFWNVTGLSAGATYTYRIRARFGTTTSQLSNPVSAVAPTCATPPPPQNQPPVNEPPPLPPISPPSHLWPWIEKHGQFEPASESLTPNPNWPTYIIAHGWDGDLRGVSAPPTINCNGSPAYAMSSIACALHERVPLSNIYAWDWADKANPNKKCDVPDQLSQIGSTLWQDLRVLFYQALFQSGGLASANRQAAAYLGDAVDDLKRIYKDAKLSGDQAKTEGSALALALKDLIQANNGRIGSKLHFIGHSHGGGLLGQTARELSSSYVVDSLTALDTPRVAGIDTQALIDPSSVGATAFFYYTLLSPGGVGQGPIRNGGTNVHLYDLQAGTCSTVAHTWIHGCDAGCGGTGNTAGWYPNAVTEFLAYPAFDGQDVSILDVDQFPTGYFFESDITYYKFHAVGLGACCYSYGCEIMAESECDPQSGGTFQGVGSNCESCSSVTARGESASSQDPNLIGMSVLLYDPLNDASSWEGTNAQLVVGADPNDPANIALVMSEDGEGSFFKEMTWPSKVVHLTFDYMFREPRGAESLTVYLNDEIIYYDNAETSLATGQLKSSGAIYIGQTAGTVASLTFVLRTDGTPGGSVVLDNLRTWGFIPGDLNGDSKLDGLDIQLLVDAVLANSTDPGDLYIADFDGDHVIDEVDFPIFVDAVLGQ